MAVRSSWGPRASGRSGLPRLRPFGMVGLGRIFEAYRTGRIEGDDEVALSYCPYSLEPLTVPQVNVRFWLDRLVVAGLIDARERRLLFGRSRSLYYADRTPERLARVVLESLGAARLGVIRGQGYGEITDVKAEDARAALASLARLCPGRPEAVSPRTTRGSHDE